MEYRPLNKPKFKNTWPRPKIETIINKVQTVVSSTIFHICFSHCKIHLHEESKAINAFMTTEGVM